MKNKITNTLFLVTLISIITFFSVSYILIPTKTFSEHENRIMQTFPTFNLEKLLNGTYTRQLHNYFSDQINLRTKMIEIRAITELIMGKKENNSVALTKDGYLVEIPSYTENNYRYLKNNLSKIENLMNRFEKNNIQTSSAIIPRKIDVLTDKLPPLYSPERDKIVWQYVNNSHINLLDQLSKNENSFYKTDHHWTAEGAYTAYTVLASELGFSPLPLDFFKIKTLSNEFFGTTYSKSGFFFINYEKIKAPTIESGKYKMTVIDTNVEFDTLYDVSYINKKDKYATFLSGNNAHVKIEDTQNPNKETLLIIKDSFYHSLAPYLCEHYNLELIDPRYFNGSIEKYINENNINSVLFLFGLDTLATTNLTIR